MKGSKKEGRLWPPEPAKGSAPRAPLARGGPAYADQWAECLAISSIILAWQGGWPWNEV